MAQDATADAPQDAAKNTAQEMGVPKPAKQLAALEGLVGHYEGEGFIINGPGAGKMPWTARSSYKWGFGNHWLLEHTQVSMDGMPLLVFHTATGWDAEASRFIAIVGSNMGDVRKIEIDFIAKNKMITIESLIEEGQRVVTKSITTFGKEGFSFEVHRSDDGGESYLHLGGKFKRTKAFVQKPVDASFPMPQDIPELEVFARAQGNYKLTGKMIPMPGAPAIEISGTESVMLAGGGSYVVFQVKGDPLPGTTVAYEATGGLCWNAKRGCYRYGYVSNMGESGVLDGYFDKEKNQLILVHSGTAMGKPIAIRNVMQLGDSGALTKTWTDAMHGSAKTSRDFEGTFEKIQ
jgi:Protein of unknown function (DUF1579)